MSTSTSSVSTTKVSYGECSSRSSRQHDTLRERPPDSGGRSRYAACGERDSTSRLPGSGVYRRGVVGPTFDRLPHGLGPRRILRKLFGGPLQTGWREALLLQDRVSAVRPLSRVKSRPVTHLLQRGHDSHEPGFTHAIELARATTGTGRGENQQRERDEIGANERCFRRCHVAARLLDRFQCVKRA